MMLVDTFLYSFHIQVINIAPTGLEPATLLFKVSHHCLGGHHPAILIVRFRLRYPVIASTGTSRLSTAFLPPEGADCNTRIYYHFATGHIQLSICKA